jgi:membrane-associated protease RseP (regulator of RpoE activity)
VRIRQLLPWILFLLTLLTTTFVGAAIQGVNLLQHPGAFQLGLPYSLGLLSILVAHEFGHYFAAKRHKMQVSRPHFIPVPFGMGTFGAVIDMKDEAPSRRALFDVAAAGPIAGLIVAIPVFLIGLHLSATQPHFFNRVADPTTGSTPILFASLAKLFVGSPFHAGHAVVLSGLAYAGWLGIWLTGLNLLPIGQLDGGHISRAMFGADLAEDIGEFALYSLMVVSVLLLPGLRIWAVIVALMGSQAPAKLKSERAIPLRRRVLGYAVFGLMLLVILPAPHWM